MRKPRSSAFPGVFWDCTSTTKPPRKIRSKSDWHDHSHKKIWRVATNTPPISINALKGGEMFKFNGNVPNTGIITNLPESACVEVPVLVDKAGFHPIHVGTLQPETALRTQLSSGIEELVSQAIYDHLPISLRYHQRTLAQDR